MHRFFFATLVLLSSLLIASPAFGDLKNEVASAPSMPVQEGDRCIVGGVPLDDSDVVLLVKGRRVPVSRAGLEEFKRNPQRYFSQLQAKGALFAENTSPVKPNYDLFVLASILALLLFCAGLSSAMALSRGLNPTRWFLLGACLNVFAPLYLLRQKLLPELPEGFNKLSTTRSPVPCPQCGSSNHPSSEKCIACESELKPSHPPEAV